MRSNNLNKSGFTIVELLIVIVVIAILAAITITVFNGIQQRATNARIISGVKTYYAAILQYKTVNGSYPVSSAGCIGSGYEDITQCWTNDQAGGAMEAGFASAAFDTAIAPFLNGTKPSVGGKKYALYGNDHMRTGMYYPGGPGPGTIEYYLVGKYQTCAIGRTAWANGPDTTQCAIDLQ